jgi:acyl-CoA thioesterase-1
MKKNRLSAIKKARYSRLLWLVAFMSFVSGCVDRNVKNIGAEGKVIICFGDSITFGSGSKKGEDFPSVLAKMAIRQVINAGIEGDVTATALKRLDSDVLDREPFLVIIEFGGNDFLNKIPLEETAKNIETMIQILQKKGIMVAVFDIGTNMVMSEYGAEYKRLCKQYGAIFIPQVLEGIMNEPALKSDVMHPNAKGYKIVAHRVFRAILPYLNQNTIARKFKEKIIK